MGISVNGVEEVPVELLHKFVEDLLHLFLVEILEELTTVISRKNLG